MRYTSSILAVLASTALAGDIKARDACSDACATAYDTCRTKADANRAACAADYAGCLGYNPFESGSLVAPTACAGGTIMSTAAAPNATKSMPGPMPPPKDTTKPVQVAGAENIKPAVALLAVVGAVAFL